MEIDPETHSWIKKGEGGFPKTFKAADTKEERMDAE